MKLGIATRSVLDQSWLSPLFLNFGYREVIRALWRASVGVPFKTFSAIPIAFPCIFTKVKLYYNLPVPPDGRKKDVVGVLPIDTPSGVQWTEQRTFTLAFHLAT